jgi:3,4-dihydroxyphenylacetate 2,3-dioxygenase
METSMTGVIATTVVAHVPTLGLAKNTPAYQETLVAAERSMGAALRKTLEPDLWVVVSTHWVATFDWLVTMQAVHEGVCVADEAPNLIPGSPYKYRGDPEFAAALIEAFGAAEIPCARNDSPHYAWDYGTFVPLQHIDPEADVPVVCLPSVLMASHEECLRAGAAVHAAARTLGRRAIFVTSSALSHVLARGRQNWPTPERVAADHRFISRLKEGALDEAIGAFTEYSRFVGAEMGGRPLATMLGVARAMVGEGKTLAGRQYGDYAQSSGSGNVVLLLSDPDTLATIP